MKKVNVELQDIGILDAGIIVYANELTLRLMHYNDITLRGTVFRRGLFHACYDPKDYERFNFPIKFTRLPSWAVFDKPSGLKYKLLKPILSPFAYNYNFLAGDNDSDVFLFFRHWAPDIPIKGKVLACVYDLIPFRIPWTCPRELIEHYTRAFENILEKSTKIITDSEFSKRDIIDYTHIDESRIDVVCCGVNAEEFLRPFDREAIRAKYNLPEKYILYFGTCGPRKNVESVIRAYACLPEVTRQEYALVITNPKEAVRACAVENNVTPLFIENVSREDKPTIYQMSSVLVWPSLYEGFGLPIVEAQAAGTPVVCSNVTSLPEVAGDAAVLVEPMDTKSIAAAIERCLYDEPFRLNLIAKGHENIKRFSWDESAKKLHDIILSL